MHPDTARYVGWLVKRRERWSLTFAGRLAVVVALSIVALLGARSLHAFLAVNDPVGGQFLVVEAWLPDYAMAEAARAFRQGRYEKVIAAGTIDEERDVNGENREFFAAWKMMRLGIDEDRIALATRRDSERDRTFHSALAVRTWLRDHGLQRGSIDVVTMAAHARRSRLLFSRALGDGFDVGVIGVTDRRFDASHWWRSSAGVRVTVDETIAYLYARTAPFLGGESSPD